jgi:hypothetical protein
MPATIPEANLQMPARDHGVFEDQVAPTSPNDKRAIAGERNVEALLGTRDNLEKGLRH